MMQMTTLHLCEKKTSGSGARPKDPYAYERIPMSRFPSEKDGLPLPKTGERTAETSFTEGLNYAEAQETLVNEILMSDYPKYGKGGNYINLDYIVDQRGKGRVYGIGPVGVN